MRRDLRLSERELREERVGFALETQARDALPAWARLDGTEGHCPGDAEALQRGHVELSQAAIERALDVRDCARHDPRARGKQAEQRPREEVRRLSDAALR